MRARALCSQLSARVAAVLVTTAGIRFTSVVVPESLMASFQRRRDNQIQGLELLSIALGMCTLTRTMR